MTASSNLNKSYETKNELEEIICGEKCISEVRFKEIEKQAQRSFHKFIINGSKNSDLEGITAVKYQIIGANKINEIIDSVSGIWEEDYKEGLYKKQIIFYFNADKIYWELAKKSAGDNLFKIPVKKPEKVREYILGSIKICNEAIECAKNISDKNYYIMGFYKRSYPKKALYFLDINSDPRLILDSLNDSLEFLKFKDSLSPEVLAKNYANLFYIVGVIKKQKIIEEDQLKNLIGSEIDCVKKAIKIFKELGEESKAINLRKDLREFKKILKERRSRA